MTFQELEFRNQNWYRQIWDCKDLMGCWGLNHLRNEDYQVKWNDQVIEKLHELILTTRYRLNVLMVGSGGRDHIIPLCIDLLGHFKKCPSDCYCICAITYSWPSASPLPLVMLCPVPLCRATLSGSLKGLERKERGNGRTTMINRHIWGRNLGVFGLLNENL